MSPHHPDTITESELAGLFDHTLLAADATEADLRRLCSEAVEHGFAMVAINSGPVKLCAEVLRGTGVHVGAAIGFPLGQTTIDIKVAETRQALADGADEIDYVINVGRLKDGQHDYLRREMREIVAVCRDHGAISKVIFENCYLTEGQKTAIAEITGEVQPDFAKTSTGFGTGGATVEDMALMRRVLDGRVKLKAAGGIRSWQTAARMLTAGAERLGARSSIPIMTEFRAARAAASGVQ